MWDRKAFDKIRVLFDKPTHTHTNVCRGSVYLSVINEPARYGGGCFRFGKATRVYTYLPGFRKWAEVPVLVFARDT